MCCLQEDMRPKTYLDRQNRRNSRYYFVSYSHKDKDCVYELLNELYINDVNYWYDKELDPGDVWDERVVEYINNPHTVGAIIFLSCDSLISDAVQKELDMLMELRKKRTFFRITPVITKAENDRELFYLASEKTRDVLYSDKYDKFRDLLLNSKYITMDGAAELIIDVSQKDNAKEEQSINTRSSFIHELPHYTEGTKEIYQFGKYPFEEDGQEKPIEWQLATSEGNIYYFITRYCIDFVDKNGIDKTINEVKRTIHGRYIEDILPVYENFLINYSSKISHALPTDYADRNRQQLLRLFWVRNDTGSDYVFYNAQNVKIEGRIQSNRLNAGIRLVMKINNNKIGGYEKDARNQ